MRSRRPAEHRPAPARWPGRRVPEALLDALAVVSPVDCAGCGVADRSICSSCQSALSPRMTSMSLPSGIPVTSALVYEGVVRQILLAFKEQGRTDVARPLGVVLSTAIQTSVRGEVELATVPSSRAAYRRRGYDPVRLLVLRAGFGRPQRVLVPVRRTARQKTLSRADREVNLVGSMTARGSLAGRRFLLVDDVSTTGSTLTEAARALREADGTVVAAATLAYTPARHPGLAHTSP